MQYIHIGLKRIRDISRCQDATIWVVIDEIFRIFVLHAIFGSKRPLVGTKRCFRSAIVSIDDVDSCNAKLKACAMDCCENVCFALVCKVVSNG